MPPPAGNTGNFLSPCDKDKVVCNDAATFYYKTPNNGFGPYSTFTTLSWIDEDLEVAGEEPLLYGIKFYPVYEVSGTLGVRRVKLTIAWDEPD